MMFLMILISLFVIAFLYSSVGHGGASGYIAIFSLFGVALSEYKPLVLLLNIIISGFAFVQFYRAGYFNWKMIRPFIVTSVPFSFLGATVVLKPADYHLLLGVALVFPIMRLVGIDSKVKDKVRRTKPLLANALSIGALLGFTAGLLNIGGGIFLSPILILMSWASAKESAAASAFFIFCNSLAGLIAINSHDFFVHDFSVFWLVAAISGGLLGAYSGSNLYRQSTVRYLLVSVMSIASVKLLFF